MAGNKSLKREHKLKSDLKKQEDDSSGSTVISAMSPRYVRKKRIPISQARKYHSQLSAQGKIYNRVSTEKHVEDVVFKECGSGDYWRDKDYQVPNFNVNRNFPNKVTEPQTFCRTLRHSNSFSSLSDKSISNLSKSKSCDNLLIQVNENTVVEPKLTAEIKTGKKSTDISSYSEGISTNTNNDAKSRRSSTSTIRERNSSQDSSFSQISASEAADVKEAEEALQIIEVIDLTNTDPNPYWKPQHSRSKSDATSEISKRELENIGVFSLPSSFSNKDPVKRKSIFEGQQMIVPTECFFPRPQQGQSLTSFLSSNEFNISAELDRENAHFCISDALIAAIEHMKCSRTMKKIEEEGDDDESDEEIRKLTQRIRIRRRERHREKILKSIVLLSDGKTDTTSQSTSPPISSHSSDYEVDSLCSEDEIEDVELTAQTDSNLNFMKESGLSLSMASLYSEADIHKAQMMQQEAANKKLQESDSVNLTAESVALSLLKKFSEKHLPKASDLQWLVSEQEAPQQLLPLPDSWPISPDVIEEEYNLGNTRLRGNLEWAPPRPQIIFFIHPYMKRKEIIAKQKFRCAGCGMKIEKNYISRFRYCEYFGKYFCQCCHSNSLAYIPGRILWKWDFSKYYVSKFAWGLLDQMYSDPLFNVEDINKKLYDKVRLLDLCRYYRLQLFYLKDFIKTCRKAERHMLLDLLEKQHHHIIYEPHVYSVSDFVQVKNGELSKHLNQMVNLCLDHVKKCILCQAKGFICEICRKDSDVIFPFQFAKVILCQTCGSCFHKRCCKKIKCPRCVRIQERKKRLAELKSDEEL